MTAPNPNYVSGILNFSGASYFEAASAPRFNPGAADFGFSCLFSLNGSFMSADEGVVDRHFLFGNELGNDGWSLRIARGSDFSIGDTDNVAYLVAVLGTGAALRTSALRLDLAPANPNLGTACGLIKRLIQATAFYRAADNALWLCVNGTPVAVNTVAGTPGSSAAAPRIGYSPAGADPASYANIHGAAFLRDSVNLTTARAVGLWAGESWSSARGTFGQGFLSDTNSLDWTYRWEASAAAPNILGTITKSAAGGGILATPPLAPAVLEDVGSSGVTNLAGTVPGKIPMNRVGTTVLFTQERNPVWYQGGAPVQPIAA